MYFYKSKKFPNVLDEALRSYFWNGKHPTTKDTQKLSNSLNHLWPLLAQQRGQANPQGNHYSSHLNFAEAYAAYYLPVNLMKLPLILEECEALGLSISASNWLDFGCGPGTIFWGLSWWLLNHQKSLSKSSQIEFTGLDHAEHFLKIAHNLAGSLNQTIKSSHNICSSWKKINSYKHTLEIIDEKKPNVISFSNSLAEIYPDLELRKRELQNIVQTLIKHANADGQIKWLIFIEPGSLNASRELILLRDSIKETPGIRVWLPCLSTRKCGALERATDWCHEEAEFEFPHWVHQIGSQAELKKEALVFSYLVVSIGGSEHTPKDWPLDGYRVVSQRMQEKGLTQCYVCSKSGKHRIRVLNSRRTPDNSAFIECSRGQIFRDIEFNGKGDVAKLTAFQPPQ